MSIVRFRTPIKDPEELGYLFLTIAVGLGFGAGYGLVTIIVSLFILFYLWIQRPFKAKFRQSGEFMIVIRGTEGPIDVNAVSEVVKPLVLAMDIARLDNTNDATTIYFNVSVSHAFNAQELIQNLEKESNFFLTLNQLAFKL